MEREYCVTYAGFQLRLEKREEGGLGLGRLPY